ncbi:MAG: hypothetical protein COA79_07775 [Planctomycetota bacterium]|nr:MAG: hypothetical protein COA79_07775 [Planctomycetota bacterium]
MTFEKTSILMWDLFTSQFGIEKENIWYFKNLNNINFLYGLNFFAEKLWILPMNKTIKNPYDFESTAYVSNQELNKFSTNSRQLLNDLFGSELTIFQTRTSSIERSINNIDGYIDLKGQGELSQSHLFKCGGMEAVNISVEYINRINEFPTIFNISETPLQLDKSNAQLITNHSKKIYNRYNTKTAVIANETIQKSTVKWLNNSGQHSEFSKLFFNYDEALDWVL